MTARVIILFFHFLGFGTFVTLNIAATILSKQYKAAPDLQQKAVILKAMRPFGLLSPIAILVMIVTGIGNMHMLGYGLFDASWLTIKIGIFAVAIILGSMFGIWAKKRGELVGSMLSGKAPADANNLLASYDSRIHTVHMIMPFLLLAILALSIIGRLGGLPE